MNKNISVLKEKTLALLEQVVSNTLTSESAQEKLFELYNIKCEHKNITLIRDGKNSMCGTVVCLDCGHTRDWDAY